MSKRPPLLSVDDALEQILVDVQPLAAEPVALTHALGRVLAAPLAAKRTQPPFPASAMDGYAVRHADLFEGAALTCVGEAAAGHAFSGAINAGECVRIFTGAPVPSGADTILIQENARANGTKITVLEAAERGRYVRPAGLDFAEGDEGLKAGTVLSPADISLAAAMDHPRLPVRRKPRIAVISTGDELVEPGQERRDDQIVSSNNYGIQAMIEDFGGEPMDIGIVKDTLSALESAFDAAADADIIITLGGASVGDHDLVHHALGQRGVSTAFWKLAMRPGKPMMFGTRRRSDGGHQRFMGLPGNPVSSLVCAIVFLKPLVRALVGIPAHAVFEDALLDKAVPANDQREEYMRARLVERDGQTWVSPFDRQDSSILSLMATADCLMRRPAHGPKMNVGEPCQIIRLR